MRLCNFSCCKFLYLKSFILFRKYFSKLESHKTIRDKGFYLYQFNNTYTTCWSKPFTIFFWNAGKTQNVPKSEFERFWKIMFGRLYACNIYIVTTRVSELYTWYMLQILPPKKLFNLQEFHIWHRHLFNYLDQTQLQYSVCLCFISLKVKFST